MPEVERLDASGLVDLLDRVIDRGAVVNGTIIIQLAEIDLVRLDLRLLLAGVETATVLPVRNEAERQVGRERAESSR